MSSPGSPINNVRTPWTPSKGAIRKVLNPLPKPVWCPYCGSDVVCVNNSEIYGHEYGDWPWAYMCVDRACNSYVGLHPYTDIPLGTLADTKTRQARVRAKKMFNPLWQEGTMTRREAYSWLAGALNLPVSETHFGWFDCYTCYRVVRIIMERK